MSKGLVLSACVPSVVADALATEGSGVVWKHLSKLYVFPYLFLAALDFHCCAWAFSSCSAGGFSCS